MLARLLRRLMLAELLLYLAGGAAVHAATGLGVVSLLLIATITALCLRAIIAAVLFSVSWAHRSPLPVRARIGPGGRARIILGEYLSLLLLYTVFQPFPRLADLGRPRGHNTLPPVLLIHGFFCNRGFWWYIRRGLAARGAGFCETVDLEPPFGDIDGYAPALRRAVDRLISQSRQPKVALVCHSMGGLAARSLMAADPAFAEKIAMIVTLGTPHHGTVLAWLARGTNIREMRPNSTWLQRLNHQPGPTAVYRASIYSHYDDIVAPQESSRLEGWRNVGLAGPGHLAMAFSPTILRHVTGEIRAGMKRP